MIKLRLVLLIALILVPLSSTSRSWPVNTFTFFISDLLGNDGEWQAAFEEAGRRWTDAATRFRIVTEEGAGVGYCTSEGNNSSRFSSTVCGDAFGSSTLAVASSWFVGDEITKVDISFNNAKNFDVYDGPGKFSAVDFRRVAVHELGHAMGLPHSSETEAIMFATSNDTFIPTFEDVTALRNLYGGETHSLQLAVDGPGVIRVSPSQDGTGVVVNNTFTVRNLSDVLDCLQPNCLLTIQDGLRLSITAEPNSGAEFSRWEGTSVTGPSVQLAPLAADRSLTAFFSVSGSGSGGTGAVDTDGDGVPDASDQFPNDSSESVDTDGDGIGNNTDSDDDGDGISDSDENRFGLNPLDPSDASQDLDGDGVSNLDEVNRGTDPTVSNRVDATRNGILEFKYAWFETSESQSSARISVHRISGSTGSVSVDYRTFNSGSARAGRDYSSSQGTLSWADGEVGVKTFEVSIFADSLAETEHDIGLELFGATNGAELGLNESVLVVRNDDLAGDGLALNGIVSANRLGAVNESDGQFVYEIGRFRGSDGQVSVSLTVEASTADESFDFLPVSQTVVWADGELGWKSVSIPIVDDEIEEGVESFVIRLAGDGGIFVREEFRSTVDIIDDETPTTQSYRFPRTFMYGVESTESFASHLLRATPEENIQLSILGFDDTSTEDDYVRRTDTFVWPTDAISRSYSIALTDDNVDESINGNRLETFFVVAATDTSFDNVVAVAGVGMLDREDTDLELDTDQDGLRDIEDIDDDNDSFRDWDDRFPLNPFESLDTDGDGIGNNDDFDDDGDGISDVDDAFPLDTTLTSCISNLTGSRRIASGQFIQLPIHGTCLMSSNGASLGIPTSATAATLNVTAVTPDAAGFVTVWPCGTRPNASNLNYVAGDVVPNGVIAPIGSNGSVCLYSQSATDMVVDVAGWFEGDAFVGATPQRLVDTRNGTGGLFTPIDSSGALSVSVTNISATKADGSATMIPSGTGAVSLNITVVNPATAGFITVYPCDVARPNASNLNFVAGQVVANGVIAPTSSSGDVCIYSSQQTDVIVDLAGWFPGNGFTPATPIRFVDTRDGTGTPATKLGPAGQLSVAMRGAMVPVNGNIAQIPQEASAVALNVTVVNPEAPGFVTVWPCSAARPNASNLNFVAGQVVPNNVVAPIGDQGNVCFFSSQNTDIIVDVSGYFTGVVGNQFVGATPKRFVDTRDGTGPIAQ